jgi:hypothetical protein
MMHRSDHPRGAVDASVEEDLLTGGLYLLLKPGVGAG